MPPSDSFAPIDNDSKDYLDDVKKKKPRYFALIVKGADIRKLIVAKKPIKTAQITAAKAEGAKGDAYLGVCSGGGQEITFEIVTQDGEGKDPCKISKLREFLDEHAGLKVKPEFRFVPEGGLTAVADDENANLNPGGQPTATVAPTSGGETETNESESTDDGEKGNAGREKLTAAFNKLTPLIKQALAAQPDKKLEVLTAAGEVKRLIEDPQPSAEIEAKTKLLDLSKLLQTLVGSANAEKLGIQTGIVKRRQFMITRFKELPLEIKPHLTALRQQMEVHAPQDDLDEVVQAIETRLQDLYDELRDRVDDSINAGDPAMLDDLEGLVMKNELVNHLLNNPLVDGTPFRAACLDAIREVQQAMAS